jgi:hypothetical protein
MALSGAIKNFRHGRLVFADSTGSPISMEVKHEPGDFAVDGLTELMTETTPYEDRGVFDWLSYTKRVYASFSLTAYITALLGATGAGNIGIPDVVMKLGGYAAGVSTSGAGAGIPWTTDLTYTLEGTGLGDSADGTLVMTDCRLTLGISEGDPDAFKLAGICYGSITFT